jgi:putative intracellular protease/amidase
MTDADLGKLLTEANTQGKIIAPFCHGPAGLLSAVDAQGTFAFAGRRVTVFTNEEELGGGTGENTPWFVEDELKGKGATVENGAAWSSHVIRDGNLISGQNPQSSEDVAKEVLKALDAKSFRRTPGPGYRTRLS